MSDQASAPVRGPAPGARRMVHAAVLGLLLAACGGGARPAGDAAGECADVVEVAVRPETAGTYRFDVTVRSADTGWEKYADAWQVRAPDGSVLGTRILTHPHVEEQPFTRTLTGVAVPAGVDEVVVAARDLVAGYCGETATVDIP